MASSLICALTVTAHHTDIPPRPITEGEQGGLLHALAAVSDPRDPRGVRYPLAAQSRTSDGRTEYSSPTSSLDFRSFGWRAGGGV